MLPRPGRECEIEIAAAILTKGLTAWMAINAMAKPSESDVVLVQGTTGGVGNLLARWLRSRGFKVIGTGSRHKLAELEQAVDHAFGYGTSGLDEHIGVLAPRGVDIVYELVGATTFTSTVGAIRDGGTIAMIGAASGGPAIDEAELNKRGIRLVRGSTSQHVTKNNLQDAADELFEAWRNGVFGVINARKYPLSQAQQAHTDILERSHSGPIVLIP